MSDAHEAGIAALTRLKRRWQGDKAGASGPQETLPDSRDESRTSVWLPRDDDSPDLGGEETNAPTPEDELQDTTAAATGTSRWMAIAKQAPRPTTHEVMPAEANGDNTEPSRADDSDLQRPPELDNQGSSEWLPEDISHEENPLATGAWLPAKDPPPSRTPVPSRWLPTELEAKPVQRDSWLPPELMTESEREASGSALAATPAPEPAVAPTPEPIVAPAPEPVAAPAPEPVAAPEPRPETAVEFTTAGQRDETADYGRRTRAVNAYCRELFAATRAPGVANQILDSLSGAISEDVALLKVTRTGAAERLAGEQQQNECTATPGRLAARANGTLEASERDRLERHLASCLVCMAEERRAKRADMAFAAVVGLKSSDH